MLLFALLMSCSINSPADVETGAKKKAAAVPDPTVVMASADSVPASMTRESVAGGYSIYQPVPAVRMPGGQAITRECYARATERRAPSGAVGGYGSGGGSFGTSGATAGRSAPTTASPTPPPVSAPMATAPAAPMADMAANKPMDGLTASLRSGETKAGASQPASVSNLESLADDGDASRGVAGGMVMDNSNREAGPMPVAQAPAKKKDSRQEGRANMDAPAEPQAEMRRVTGDEEKSASEWMPPQDPNLDWGGTTYLSNDDSMSLASAQRLLWAVKNRASFTTAQIRPHELLNYFSFDTVPVPTGQLFSVHASAEQTGPDTLTVAFAVQGAKPPRQALDLTLVVDRSGSMSDEGRMNYVKRGLTDLSQNLLSGDRVNLVIFDNVTCVPLENYVMGRDDPSLLSQAISDLAPRGSTDMNSGLNVGYQLARTYMAQDSQPRNRRVMVLTDALLNTGTVNQDVVSEIGKAYEESGIRLTGVGVGREFNDKILDMLTEKGKGAYVYLGSEAVVDRVFGVGFDSLVQTIAHDVRFAMTLPDSLALERFYGEESSTNPDDIQPINYYAGTTQLFLQDLKIRNGAVLGADKITLNVTFKDAATGQQGQETFRAPISRMMSVDTHNVDKARALMSWSDLLLAQAMGSNPCDQPLATYQERASRLTDDAEIAYVNDLISGRCGGVRMPVTLAQVAYKVKLDSDIQIAEVALQCAGQRRSEVLSAGVKVASFSVTPGSCTLTLQGTVPMSVPVQVPQTGGETRCIVRGGRLSCG